MTKLARTIPKLTILALLLAALAAPAGASIAYTSCSSSCTSSSGTYAIWQSAPGSAGLTFSMSPATFASGNLISGIYTDPTGTVLTGYSGINIDTLMSVPGSSLLEGNNGSGTGIEVKLPANTYAFAMNITTFGSTFTTVGVGLGDHNVTSNNYNITIPTGGSVQFFSIISDTPLTELFFGPIGQGSRLQINDFEIGQESPTPEAASVTMIGGGLVLLGLLRRRIHKPNRTTA